MKNLFERAAVEEVQARMALLRPESERLWGSMNVAQAQAHCALAMEWALGDRIPDRIFPGPILGRFIKPFVVRGDRPILRNAPTAKSLLVADGRELEAERGRLSGLIERFAAAGPAGCTTNPHSFFGPLKPEEWAVLMYKHLDHHLRQFGV